ncbi:flagellar motor protein MotB [Bacillus sp. ISL-51]|uniref:flagellar motor protein MotS n=1 Tax=unclassified Bacillus (in: firmicutes) TaxID=185979 RepID=UPI001BECA396|nr:MULTISPECIES: flagellar motor protein MotS [unclassified Bacillus (in: firmicutes)]MBT2574066.1 flagellar motor protein MotB [Bacillus sp. ISL-51]MBT2636018.1 flagellar motor protein MotB [Bacillus sp. ISL-26]
MKLRKERFERRSKTEKSNASPKWMVTFADLITLILVFFILLFSMSQIDSKKFNSAVKSIHSSGSRQDAESASSHAATGKDEQDKLLQNVNTYIKTHHLHSKMTAKRDERGVVLVLQEAVLFQSGEAEVLKNAEPLLHQIAVLLKTIPNAIQVEGHTDSRRISTFKYPSNWELSSARAASVIQYFTVKEDFPAKRFISVGYADTKPVKDNKTAGHMMENRRVEIVIKKTAS